MNNEVCFKYRFFGRTQRVAVMHLILASFFFLHILAFILPKDMKKMRNIDKPMGFRLSKKEHLVAFTVGWQIWDIGDFICK